MDGGGDASHNHRQASAGTLAQKPTSRHSVPSTAWPEPVMALWTRHEPFLSVPALRNYGKWTTTARQLSCRFPFVMHAAGCNIYFANCYLLHMCCPESSWTTKWQTEQFNLIESWSGQDAQNEPNRLRLACDAFRGCHSHDRCSGRPVGSKAG